MKKTKSKAIIALTIIAAIILSLAVSRVSANDSYKLRFSINANATENHSVEVVDDGQHLKIDGQYVDAKLTNGEDVQFSVADVGNGVYEMTIPNGEEVVLNFYGNNQFDLYANGQPIQSNQTTFSTGTDIAIQDYVAQPGDQPGQAGGPDNIEFDIKFTNTHMNIWMNNKTVVEVAPNDGETEYTGTIELIGNSTEGENIIRFQENFGDYPCNSFTINNVEYTRESNNVVIDEERGWFITVPAATKYTIRGEGDQNAEFPRTIIWVNPDYVPTDVENAEWAAQFTFKNGYARAIAVYDEDNNKLSPEQYISTAVQPDGSRSDEYGLNKGFGWVKVKPGYRTVFEFIPEYGYQLTSITLNEQEVDATGVTNQFEVVIPEGGGNVHFAAEFTKISDVLKDGSNSIEGGSIELAEGTIVSGTAQLRVNDVDIPADKIKGFEDAAGDYSVKTYLDIDLFQVFYKGKDDDEDVWENKLDELEKEATISLKLADGLTADDIVIVHNVHDGDEYEVIKIESYDEATNTITFKTKSFSNYAIATKGDGKKSGNPKTGDKLIIFGAAGAIALIVLAWAIIKKNKKKDN